MRQNKTKKALGAKDRAGGVRQNTTTSERGKMRTLFLGYNGGVGGAATASSAGHQALVRRQRFERRAGSGRVTSKRSFNLEGQLLAKKVEDMNTTAVKAAAVDTDERASGVEEVGVSFRATARKRASHVFQSKRRTRVLDRKSGTGRSTTLRLFPLEAQELSPKVVSPIGAGAPSSMEIVPYAGDHADPMEVDLGEDSAPQEDFCCSPDAGYVDDAFGSPVAMQEEPEEAGVARAVAPRRPRGEPHQRLRNEYKNRKSLAPHGLRVVEETGLRRSTRRRVKPLQYWRNEKVEYGREHKTLPTIASIALRSPDELWPAPDKRKPRKTKSRTEEMEKELAAACAGPAVSG